jgi:lysophospholipase L1-like esterase
LEHADAWSLANDEAQAGTGPLWVVLGDSTAQAVGAGTIQQGYVAAVRDWLSERAGSPWRVVNLSRSGALTADVLADQLPAIAALAPDLVSCAVGANDLLRRSPDLREGLAGIAGALPAGSLLANLPRGLREADAVGHNEVIAALAQRHDLRLVDLWSATGPPWRGKYAADWFHPNDIGYQDWATAFTAALSAP